MIWVADYIHGGVVVWAISVKGTDFGRPRWYFVSSIVYGLATASETTPRQTTTTMITNLRALTQDDYDLLIAEERARAALSS